MDRDDAIDWAALAQLKYLGRAQCNLAKLTAAQVIGDWCHANGYPRWNAGHLLSELERSGFEVKLK